MVPYLVCFGVSIVSTYMACNIEYKFGAAKKVKYINYLFSIIAVFAPCFLAAVRDSSIGFDVSVYGDSVLKVAEKSPDLFYLFSQFNMEKLYLSIAYLMGHYGNRYLYYLILQFLVIAPVYSTLMRKETKKYAWVGMLVYFCWLYPFSLNIMRQSIAIAIVIWGYRYVQERKFMKYLIVIAVACGFHLSALLGLAVYLIDLLTMSDAEQNISSVRKFFATLSNINKVIILFATSLIIIFGTYFINIISSVTGRFSRIVTDMSAGFNGLEIRNLLIMAVFIILLYILISGANNSETKLLLYLITIGAILYQIKVLSAQMYRISLFFTGFIIIAIPMFINRANNVRRLEITMGRENIKSKKRLCFWSAR